MLSKRYKRKSNKRNLNKRKSKKGGSYYAYNRNPLRFTSSTSQMGGGFFNIDTRETLFPQALVNTGRSVLDSVSSTNSSYYGRGTIVPSDPTSQPIGNMRLLKF
jgi:hypothetical protein